MTNEELAKEVAELRKRIEELEEQMKNLRRELRIIEAPQRPKQQVISGNRPATEEDR